MTKKILIIDDEPVFMRSIIDILEIEGIKRTDVIYCSQVDEGFRALNTDKNNVACVSIDMLMPDPMNMLVGDSEINGLKALKQIREKYTTLPIVCFTILGEQEGGIREASEKYNATFISKTDSDGDEKLIAFFKKHYDAP